MKNIKNNTTHKNNNTKTIKSKTTKKIINWSEYNNSLISRGNLSIYISEAISNKAFLKPQKNHKVGHPIDYSDDIILLVLTIRELFRLPLRQAIGFSQYILRTSGLNWKLPDYSTLSRRMSKLNIDFCSEFHGKNVVFLVDSSGFKVFGEGEWKVRKHGIGCRRTWRETHIAIDWTTRNIIGLINAKSGVHDNTQFLPLLKQVQEKHQIKTVIGDGAYDAKDNYLIAKKLGLEFIVPPSKNATEHLNMRHYQFYDTPGWEDRNAVVRHCQEFGIDGWKADVDYHRRSLVENGFYRLKTIFGNNLKSRKEDAQYTEQCIRASLLNRFNKMGLPKYAG
jgi:hypothetical protein